MKSNKKLYIRNEEGKIQAMPLYTDTNDIEGKHLTVREGDVCLFAALVAPDDPHASWLHVRDEQGDIYTVYRSGINGEPGYLELTNARHMLTFSGNKHAQVEAELKELKDQLPNAYTDLELATLNKRIGRAQYLYDISTFENTFYRNEFTEIPNILITDTVTDASLMFYGCGDLQKLRIIETGKFECMQEMFAECHCLPAIFPYVIDMSSIKQASDVSGMFNNSSVKQVYVTNVRSDVLAALKEDPMATLGVDKVIPCYRLTQQRYKASDIYSSYSHMEEITAPLCAVEVEDATSMFEGGAALAKLPDIETCYTKVMKRMFYGCKSLPAKFPRYINISGVKKVEDLQDMFKESSVEEVIFIVSDDSFAAKITPEILGKPNITIRHMVKLTNSNHKLRDLDPDNYDKVKRPTIYAEVSNELTDASYMFEGCTMLEFVDEDIFVGAGGLEDVSSMFANCPSLVTVPKINMASVKNASNMFLGDKSLTTVPYMNLRKNKSFVNMFKGCKSLPAEFPWLIDMRNASLPASLEGMFAESGVSKVGLVNLDKSIRDDISSAHLGIPDEGVTFYHSPAWLKTEYGWQALEEILHLAVLEPRDSLSNFNHLKRIEVLDFCNVEVLSSLFSRSNTLVEIGEIRNTDKLTSASSFFAGCGALKTLPDSLDFSSAVSLNGMFSFCGELLKIPTLTIKSAKTAASMFYGCQSIKSIPAFDTDNVYDMSSMCYGCTSLKEIPKFNTESAQVMRQIFANCQSLPAIFPFEISLKSVKDPKNIEKMFSGSSVKQVTFKDVSEEIKSELTPELLGKVGLEISITEVTI